MKIGEVAVRSAIPASTLRYYEDIGLIPAPRRASGQRLYDESILKTLSFIKVAQGLGFSLTEIEQLLHGFEGDVPPSVQWRKYATKKMAEIDAVIARYQTMKSWLRRGMDCGCIDLDSCELLDALDPAELGGGKF